MVQQCSRRSYLYFISFAKKKGIACAKPRKGSVFARARRVLRPLAARPDWDNTIHDLSVWKLSPQALEARKIAYRTLPEHRVRRSVSSATPSSSCKHGPETRGLTNSTAVEKPATQAEPLKRVSGTKYIERCNRVGKENKTSAAAAAAAAAAKTHELVCRRRGQRQSTTSTILETKAATTRETSKPLQPATASALPSGGAQSATGDGRPTQCQTIAKGDPASPSRSAIVTETKFEGNQTLRASPTVDFENEVKQFEARRRILSQGLKLPLRLKARSALGKELLARSFARVEKVMDKSESSDDDSSLSVQWADSVGRFQTNMQPVPALQQRRNYNRRIQEESGAATAAITGAARQPAKYNHWGSQPQNELVYFKQPVDPAIKPRTKLAKRHFGSIQRTSPIGDWKVNFDESANDHFSLQQIGDFQRHMLRCQQDLIQEFREFKLSISKQIMNLQLDMDTVLEHQKRKDSHPAETTPSSYLTSKESPVQEGVDESVDLPTYSSIKVKKDVQKPASPSSGESSYMQLFSCYNGSQYAASRKSGRSVQVSAPPAAAVAAPESQVFDNPIYHVQTSSDKEGESSDDDASISSVELAKFLASRGGQHLKSETHVNGRAYMLPSEASLRDQGTMSPNGILELRTEETKNNSQVPYGQPQNQEAVVAIESDNPENTYREDRFESNGHTQSDSIRLGSSNGKSPRPSSRHYQTQVSRPVGKNGTPPSPGIGTYRAKPPVVAEEEPTVADDLELRLGNSGVNSATHSALNSGRSSPKDYRNRLSPSASRPLFAAGTGNSVPNSSVIPTNAKDGLWMEDTQDREKPEAAHEGRSRRKNSKPAESADRREAVFTLRGWSAAFLQPTENFQKGIPSAQTVVISEETNNRTRSPEAPEIEVPKETGKGTMKFPGRCARGGVAWTVSEPPCSAKKVRNASLL